MLPADYDGDGDIDILANTYRLNRNLYYRNDGGTLTEVGMSSGLSGRMTRWGELKLLRPSYRWCSGRS